MFTLPKLDDLDLKGLTDARAEALKVHADLSKIDDDKLTDEQLDELEAAAAGIAEIDGAVAQRNEAAEQRAARIAAAKQAPAEPAAEADDKAATDKAAADEAARAEEEAAAAVIAEAEAAAAAGAEVEAQKEAVVASAAPKSVTRAVAATAGAPKAPVAPARPKAKLTVAGELGGKFTVGQEVSGMREAADAFLQRSRTMPQRKMAPGAFQRNSVIRLEKGVDDRFTLERGQQESNFEKIQLASEAVSQTGAFGNLVAAGGWCAPSETIYDIPQLAEVSGMLQIAEVNVPRGGLSFTKGPDFSQIYADSGFLQTETQAEAGELKNFIDVECPGFEEVRLDVMGYGVRAGILTNKAWPELVRHYLSETLVAHQHKKNATIINRIVALNGAAVSARSLGAVVADTLDALEIQAMRLRYKYRLGENARIEGFAPLWLVGVMRSDLAYREGVDTWAITDAQINSALAARNIYLQWVYDYQDLAGDKNVAWPTTANVQLYVQGAYVAGTEDVISLDIVHDTASLAKNTFTAAFYEEALMVFNPKASGVNVQLTIPRPAGRIGAADITNRAA